MDPNESIALSTVIEKVNRYGWWQERTILLTDKHMYSFQHTKIKRIVKLRYIYGVTKSSFKDGTEFVLHVENQYDYRHRVCKQGCSLDEIIGVLSEVYFESTNQNLPIYEVPEKSLKEFCTVKEDLKKSICRKPAESFRIEISNERIH